MRSDKFWNANVTRANSTRACRGQNSPINCEIDAKLFFFVLFISSLEETELRKANRHHLSIIPVT